MVTFETEKTEQRIRELEDYMSRQVLSRDRCICAHLPHCRNSRAGFTYYEGLLSHVGSQFDLQVGGVPLRIVVVGQEYGHGPSYVSMAERSANVTRTATMSFSERNPHMKGTTSILRLLLGRNPGADSAGERVGSGHLFDSFALVNYLLCSALDKGRVETGKGGGKGRSSPTMQMNCSQHFMKTLEILEPTVIIVQGQGVRRWMEQHLGWHRSPTGMEKVRIGGGLVDMLTFDHPSAPGKSAWWGNSLRSRYLTETVTPNIGAFRDSQGLSY